jgi:hypothetical protein
MANPTPLSNAEQLVGQIDDLQRKLQTQAPGYESLLHTIHVALSKDPDMVHLLSEDQVGVIVAGLSKRKNIIIAAADKKKSTTSKGTKLKDIGLEEL